MTQFRQRTVEEQLAYQDSRLQPAPVVIDISPRRERSPEVEFHTMDAELVRLKQSLANAIERRDRRAADCEHAGKELAAARKQRDAYAKHEATQKRAQQLTRELEPFERDFIEQQRALEAVKAIVKSWEKLLVAFDHKKFAELTAFMADVDPGSRHSLAQHVRTRGGV